MMQGNCSFCIEPQKPARCYKNNPNENESGSVLKSTQLASLLMSISTNVIISSDEVLFCINKNNIFYMVLFSLKKL